jgi:hypothetical protein
MTRTLHLRLLAATAIASVLLLGACGGSDSSSGASDSNETVATASTDTTPDDATPVETTPADSGEAGSAASGAAPVDAAALEEFTDCLSEQGVQIPEGFTPGAGLLGGAGATPGSLPEVFDPAAMQSAMAACQDKLPAGAGLGGAGLDGANGPDISAFTTCLRDNGVNIPENPTIRDINPSDPAVATASETCAALLPENLRGAFARSGTTEG